MAPDPRFVRLVNQQASVRQAMSSRVGALTRRVLSNMKFSDWFSDDAVNQSAQKMAGFSRSGQQRTADSTSSYMGQLFQATRPSQARDTTTERAITLPDSLRTVDDPLEPWTRPAAQFRYATSQGYSPDVALDRAAERAQQLADDDLLLAQRYAAQQRLITEPKVIGYRRILHPEMSAGGACGLCIAASTRRYYVEELMPIHGNCNCTQAPIYAESDPGHSLNQEDLDNLYNAAGGTTASDKLKRVRVKVQEHSELGPVLAVMGQHFQTKDEADRLKRGAKPRTLTPEAAQVIKTRATQTLDELTARRSAGDKSLADPIAFHQELIRRMSEIHQ